MARFGSIGKQYFDDAGDPLVSGKLFFYEPGTTTHKTTYADKAQSIPNANPVILTAAGRQPNIFFSGEARVVLTKSDSTQIEVRDPDGEQDTNNFETWNADRIYAASDVVIGSDNHYYASTVDNNQNSDPVTVGSLTWVNVEFIQVWSATIIFAQGVIAKGTDGLLYRSRSNGNVNNPPSSSPSYWQSLISNIGDHIITARQANGYGSTNTKRRKYSVIEASTGAAMSYTNSATLGFSVTVNEAGFYEITIRDYRAAGSALFGVSKNSAQLTTAIDSITVTDIVMVSGSGTSGNQITRTMLLNAGDVIGPHDMGTMDSTSGVTSMFSMRKVGNV